jgi:uncharacterized protein YraI
MSTQKGKTTANLRLRAGPGVDHPTLDFLLPNKKLEILAEEGDWLRVLVGRREGFVARRYVALDAKEAEEVTTPERDMEVEPGEEETGTSGRSFTTGYVNFREGPGTEHRIISTLIPNTPVEIIGESGDWLKVKVDGREGFVHRNYVSLTGDSQQVGGYVPFDSQIEEVDFQPIPIRPEFTSTQKLVAETWNKYGGMLTKFATDIGVDPGVLAGLTVGVLIQESGGNGFRNGKLLIRFENHLFFDNWGGHSTQSKKKFNKHFGFNAQIRWQEHTWRRKDNQAFQPFHGNQTLEWQVLEFASKLDPTAAKKSISMGMPQILGLNFFSAGFSSVQQMFEVFSIDNQHQLIGFFTFVKNRPNMRKAIKDADFLAFARSYNGSGQAEHYKNLITARIAEFNEIRAL